MDNLAIRFNQLSAELARARQSFVAGDRVQLHPATTAWMRGDRYATVVATQHKSPFVKILFDRSGLERLYLRADLFPIDSPMEDTSTEDAEPQFDTHEERAGLK